MEEKLQQLSEAFTAFKTANDARLKSIESKGYAPAELEGKTNELNDTISKLEGEIKSMKTALNRGGGQGGEDQTAASEKEQKGMKAYNSYLRKGNDVELKAMSVDSDEDGGYLVTPQMSAEIVKKVFESSPIRQLASVQTISTDALEILEDLDEVGSGWVGEIQARPETTTAKLKKIVIPVHEIYAQPKATQKLLDDAAFNVEAWLSGKVSEKFVRDEATAFVTGDGVAKPQGLLSYADGTSFNQVQQVETAGSGVITGDDLIDLAYALKEAYLANSSWLAKRSTVKAFRKLKDSQGRYLWEPGLNGATQATILGYPIYEANDMPAIAGSALSVVFGDIRQAYQIVDRIGIRVLRDVYTAKPHVLFYTTKRVGGAVKNFEAYKILRVKA